MFRQTTWEHGYLTLVSAQLHFSRPILVANQYTVTTSCEWDDFVQGATQDLTEHFCFIKKRHSWSRLLISEELLFNLMSYYSIFPSFLQTISLFGVQVSEGDRPVGFFFQLLTRLRAHDGGLQNLAVNGYELHYVLRYVEKHGRDLSNPWSMRKMAICHKFAREGNISSWIIVHGSKTLQDRLTAPRAEPISSLHGWDALEASAASNHLLILLDALRNWDDYIEYLSAEFKDTVSLAYCPNLNKKANTFAPYVER
ncbi:uncharacterized protein BDR25DRAFT_35692 [Lindgomyces ingoldianus]|uniref:Uncharacterized protein n=1 Tax=Lindgomyces ingoldianus TaxID=673940 RepID=A0ACB6QSM2_9PLEO|nr:uncharacterized protein BDR25DRAFT_35692 [Lindgomyces ingoldianus]KAF2469936.1 hypothetical protein BDR25DRAFT_35692 [Lindgomyces ingoldianus]